MKFSDRSLVLAQAVRVTVHDKFYLSLKSHNVTSRTQVVANCDKLTQIEN